MFQARNNYVIVVFKERKIIMSAPLPLSCLLKIKTSLLSQEENMLLEAELYICLYDELREFFREQHRNYFYLMKFTKEEENHMLEKKFIQLIIKDILSTNEYDLKGIAYYTYSFEEVIEELMAGLNNNPSFNLFCKLIDLHRMVRRDLYDLIMKKILVRVSKNESPI